MSALTKVFIVLQVILAILLVAGQIVFVNRTEDWQASYSLEKAQLTQQKQQIANLRDTDNTERTALNVALQNKGTELGKLQQSFQQLQTQNDSLKTNLATAQADNDKMTAGNTFASQALKVALDQLGTIQTQYADLQKSAATVQKQYADSSMSIADLRSRLDATERQREYLSEQVVQISKDLDIANAKIHQAGLDSKTGTAAATVNPEANIALDGKIADTRMIDKVPYATIDLGSADQVTSGMRFYVVDPESGTFLGSLKVDTVEPHAASGRLDGPHVNDVHAGNQVRTQL